MKMKSLALAFGLMLPALAAHAEDPAMTKNGMLVDSKGMTLYTFDKDAGGKSACNGGCAANWPGSLPVSLLRYCFTGRLMTCLRIRIPGLLSVGASAFTGLSPFCSNRRAFGVMCSLRRWFYS